MSSRKPDRRSGPTAPLRRRRKVRWIALGIVVVLAGVAGGYFMLTPAARPGPSFNWSVPDPDLSRMQPRVAQRIREARKVVLNRPESAEAWGRLGAVCDVHDLNDAAAPCYQWARTLSPQDYRWPYLLGYIRELQGAEVGEITGLFEQAARLEPRFAPTFFRLGDALMRQGKTREACDAYRRALELDPKLAIAHRSLGQALIAAGEARAALGHLQRALEYGPQDGAVYAAMARAYTRLGRPQDAEAAAAKSARAPIALALPDPVRYEVEKLGISSEHCLERADAFIQSGDYAAAIDQLEIVREQLPDDASVHYRLGIAHQRTGGVAPAIEHFSRAVALQDDLVDAHLKLASLLTSRQRPGEAIEHYRRALRHEPANAGVHVRLATALARGGDYQQALSVFERAASLVPLDAPAQMNWGSALMRLDDAARAIEHYRRALELNPSYASAHFNLGLALEQLGRTNEAIAAYRHAVRIDPNHAARQRLRALGALP